MKKLIETTAEGLQIYFEALEEHLPLSEILPEETPEELQKIYDENEIFTAKVTAEAAGVELAADYLGGCIYKTIDQFIEDGDYIEDMKQTVKDEAKEEATRIIKELKNI